jgi:hypothetical protein
MALVAGNLFDGISRRSKQRDVSGVLGAGPARIEGRARFGDECTGE